jgi:hypothetical protein
MRTFRHRRRCPALRAHAPTAHLAATAEAVAGSSMRTKGADGKGDEQEVLGQESEGMEVDPVVDLDSGKPKGRWQASACRL